MPRFNPRFSRFAALLGLVFAVGYAAAEDPKPDKPEQTPPLDLDDADVIPSEASSEEEVDRREALSYFASGIAQKNRRDFEGALRSFQRAHRLDPTSLKILEEIVLLSEGLRHAGERGVYGVRAIEAGLEDALLVQRLAVQFTLTGEFDKAERLFARLVEQEKKESPNSFRRVLLTMELGRTLNEAGKHKEAAEAFKFVLNALDNAKDFEIDKEQRSVLLGEAEKTYSQIGESFLKSGKGEKAAEAFDAAFAVSRDKSTYAWQMAQVHTTAGEHEKALEELDKYFDAKATDQGLAPFELLATTYEKLEKKEELLARLEKLHADVPTDLFAAFSLAQQHQAVERLAEAAELYDKVAEESGDEKEFAALTELARQQLVAIYRMQGNAAGLLGVLSAAAEQDGDLASLGKDLDEINKDEKLLEGILAAAREEIKKEDGELVYPAALAAGLFAQAAKRHDDAGEFFDAAVKADDEEAGQTLLTWGLGLLFDEKNAEAAAIFQRGIDEKRLEEKDPRMHFFLCHALELEGKTEHALKIAREATEMNDANPRIEGREAWILFHAGRHEEAQKRYVELIEKYEPFYVGAGGVPLDDVRQNIREWRLALSNICVLEGKFEEGEEWVQQVLDEMPDDPTGLNDLGYLWADQNKRLKRAIAMIEQAVKADPENHAFRDSLGWAYYRQGRFADAIGELEKAADEEEPDGVILDHLADAYFGAGQKDKALETWKRALGAFDKEREADKIKATEEKIEKNAAE